jgi:two-component system, NarL family, nitrate/nitrite response regulator NarL
VAQELPLYQTCDGRRVDSDGPFLSDGIGPKGWNSVRITIASSVRLVRESLVLILQRSDSIEVIDAVSFDRGSVEMIAQQSPDIILIDLSHDGATEFVAQIKRGNIKSKLVAFAVSEVENEVFACAAAGFSGYVPQDCNAEDLNDVLLNVAKGRMYCAPHIASAMFARLAELLTPAQLTPKSALLTSRESEILTLAESGRSNKEIARQLSISPATVKNHVHNILQKFQVGRRGEAVAKLRHMVAD